MRDHRSLPIRTWIAVVLACGIGAALVSVLRSSGPGPFAGIHIGENTVSATAVLGPACRSGVVPERDNVSPFVGISYGIWKDGKSFDEVVSAQGWRLMSGASSGIVFQPAGDVHFRFGPVHTYAHRIV